MNPFGNRSAPWIHGMFRSRALRPIGVLALILALMACSSPNKPFSSLDPLVRDKWFEQALAARGNFAYFYFRTFGPMIRSGNYERDLPLMRYNHYAHRLWIPERDWTLDEALKTLGGLVKSQRIDLTLPSGGSIVQLASFFDDDDQLHRDHYVMIMNEMGIDKLGGKSLSEFLAATRVGYGLATLTRRGELAWTAAVLARTTPPGRRWTTVDGRRISVEDVINDLINSPFFPDDRDPFACYDYHTVYALTAAVQSGYRDYSAQANQRLSEAFEVAERVCAQSIERGNAMEEIIGRLKLNGHLIEAFFNISDGAAFNYQDYEVPLGRTLEALLRDSILLRDVSPYLGPPNIFVSVPHAIHGLDLVLGRLAKARR